MGQPRPLFRLFLVFSNKRYNFYNKSMWKNVHLVYGAGLEPTTSRTESSPITTRPELPPDSKICLWRRLLVITGSSNRLTHLLYSLCLSSPDPRSGHLSGTRGSAFRPHVSRRWPGLGYPSPCRSGPPSCPRSQACPNCSPRRWCPAELERTLRMVKNVLLWVNSPIFEKFRITIHMNFLKKWANPGLFFVYFRSFKTNNTIFTTNQCEKMSCPSSFRYWELNPRP